MTRWGYEQEQVEPKKQTTEDMKKVFHAIADASKKTTRVAVKNLPPPSKLKPDKFQGR
jgi:hypothetical protein